MEAQQEIQGCRKIDGKTIKAEALNLGFFACGIAKAGRVNCETERLFMQWVADGCYADMDYMARNTDKRLDPRLLMDGLKSIVCVALNYAPAQRMAKGELQFADYALGQDYHDIVKDKLHRLAANLGIKNYRAFCDTAPVFERYWAVQSGIGWTGRNHQLIIPNAGSKFFLGELFIDVESDYDHAIPQRCGSCHACLEACPTGALSCKQGDEGRRTCTFNASKCLSYLTIENHGEIPIGAAKLMGDTVYGCDRCQEACPWNRFSIPTIEPRLQPKQELLNMTREQWDTLTVDEYRRLFKGSAVKRAKYNGLMRNIKAVTRSKNDKNENS